LNINSFPGNYKVSITTQGLLETKLEINEILRSDSSKLLITIRGTKTPLGPFDFAITNNIKFQHGNYEYDIR